MNPKIKIQQPQEPIICVHHETMKEREGEIVGPTIWTTFLGSSGASLISLIPYQMLQKVNGHFGN